MVAHGESLVSTTGGVLLSRTARVIGLDRALSKALAPWRTPLASHDHWPSRRRSGDRGRAGRGLRERHRAGARATGGVGTVASDPTVSRLIGRWAADDEAAVAAIRAARASARERASQHAGVPRAHGSWGSIWTPR